MSVGRLHDVYKNHETYLLKTNIILARCTRIYDFMVFFMLLANKLYNFKIIGN